MRARHLVRFVAGAALLAGAASACTDSSVAVPLRALQGAGPTSFLCLGDPAEGLSGMGRPITDCTGDRTGSIGDYQIPHLYALVTQPIRGEVAVIDLTTTTEAVIDQDIVVPGANFLPVGARPVDIVTTPGSMATFLANAQPGFEGIQAMPSNLVRGEGATLTSWPSCALPEAPGRMTLVLDPADAEGGVRPRCESAFGEADDATCITAAAKTEAQASGTAAEPVLHCHGDLSLDATAAGRAGRYKLAVTLPHAGGIAIVDAQAILDQDAGAFEDCPIDRFLPLDVDLPASPPAPTEPVNAACAPRAQPEGPFAQAFEPMPSGLAYDGGTLYVGDSRAPVVHRVNLDDPCDPREVAPLIATSTEDPDRVVTTTRVAVSPLTLGLKRFLYAIDVIDGSVMTFDVSDDATTRYPLERPIPANNPFQPTDRIRVQTPPREIVIVEHLNDRFDEDTGSSQPVRCDPTEGATTPGAAYQTSETYDTGAGPGVLRGIFAFVVLASGDVLVVDVDDYDATCRGPHKPSAAGGCDDEVEANGRTNEFSCRAVAPHQTRAAGFLIQDENVASNQPGLQSFPVLFDPEGAVLNLGTDQNVPRMLATVPVSGDPLSLAVGTSLRDLNASGELLGSSGEVDPTEHTLAANLIDPRAHIVDQNWTITYEGRLPGFAGRFAEFVETGPDAFELRDPTSRFCARGVMSQQAVAAEFEVGGVAAAAALEQAAPLADYVQIVSSSLVESDPYWDNQNACTASACAQAYSSPDVPTTARDFRIVEATDDTLVLERRAPVDADTPPVKCCFPGVVEFRVRGGGQWIVNGDGTGFLHHVVAAEDGTCRPSCNPNEALLESRVRTVPASDGEVVPVEDGAPGAFRNPFFRFAIQGNDPLRDTQFQFGTRGSFDQLVLSVVTNDPDVQPQEVRYLGPTGELVVSDGSLEGLTLIDLTTLSVSRQYN